MIAGGVWNSNVAGVSLEVGVFGFTFGVVNATVVIEGYIFAIVASSDCFLWGCNNGVEAGHFLLELGVCDVVLIFLSGL